MGTRLAAVGMAAAIGVGGLGVAALNPLGVAGAQEDPPAGAQEDPPAGAPAPGAPGTPGEGAHRDGPLQRALDALVADGTLTQEQADAVAEKTRAEAEAGWAEHRERAEARRAELLEAVAGALGSTPDEVKASLQDGQSFAEQAEAAGVDRQAVVDAITGVFTARIDEGVAAGRLTDAQADEAKERLPEMVDRIVDADGSRRGPGGFDGGMRERFRDRFGN